MNRMMYGRQTIAMPPLTFLSMIVCSIAILSGLKKNEVIANTAGITKLFVFGDSYADTGNWARDALPWDLPYGMTFPGQPAGRFCNGRILTDFLASDLGIPSPLPYEQRTSSGAKPQFGMNFAYGGTGVFNTSVSLPNMTTQINFFQQHIGPVYTQADLVSSMAFVSLAGNDYVTYLRGGGGSSSSQSWRDFARILMERLVLDLKHIHDLGVPKIAITALEPVGCLPSVTTFFSYQNCSDELNRVARFHNQLLVEHVKKMNSLAGKPAFFVLDLYDAFMSALKPGQRRLTLENLLTPCCQGLSFNYKCGSREGGQAKYTVCPEPGTSFFWDSAHPAQHGWNEVYLVIRSSLPLQ